MSLQPLLASSRAEQLCFGQFRLDLDAGQLLRHGDEIYLRPKTFAVLRHLLENAGRLVSKDELFAAVWPKLAVTDDVLVQSISELRSALAPDGAVIIRTVPRRGYRVDVAVLSDRTRASVAHGALSSPPQAAPPSRLARPRLMRVSVAMAIGISVAGWALYAAPLSSLLRAPVEVSRVSGRPGIAVLPFSGDDNAGSHFVDGITQDVIAALGRFPALTVMSWNAVESHRRGTSPKRVAQALDVVYQVEGKIVQAADRLQVNAQLVDAAGRILWSGQFDEAKSDVFSLHRKIAGAVAGALAARVAQAEQRRALERPTSSLEAYDLVLRARPLLQAPSRAGTARARELLRHALDLDPRYAGAHAALAESHYTDLSMGWAQSPPAALARAEESARTALSLDPAQASARIVLGRIHILNRRYEQAETELALATEINPSDAQALGGLGNLLTWLGRGDAAIEALELAQRIDPQLGSIDRFALALAYYSRHRYDDAVAQAELNLQSARDAHFNLPILAAAYAQKGRVDDADRVAASLRRLDASLNLLGFGTKFLRPDDLAHLRDGLRKARLQPG